MSKLCEYCRLEKPFMSEDTSYYDYGFKMKKYWICEDCQKDDNNKTETMLTTNHRESLAYEGQNNKGIVIVGSRD